MGHGSRQISDFWTSENLSKMSAQQPFESKAKLMFCIIERKMVSKGISLAAKRDIWTALLSRRHMTRTALHALAGFTALCLLLLCPAPRNVRFVAVAGDHADETLRVANGAQEGITALAVDPADSRTLYAAMDR